MESGGREYTHYNVSAILPYQNNLQKPQIHYPELMYSLSLIYETPKIELHELYLSDKNIIYTNWEDL